MTRVLIPVEVLKGESVSPGLMNLLGTVDVTVLGYHEVPEQTPPDQARLQFEDRATEALKDLTEEFRTAGGAADYRLVFTQDGEQTIHRVAEETDARAFAISGMTGDVDRLLVSLSGDVAVGPILEFVEEVVGERAIEVTLFMTAAEEASGEERLASAAAQLRDTGLTVQTELAVGGSPFEALIDRVAGHDAIVMGEEAPSFRSLVFGDESERVAAASVGPVLVVRHDEFPDA